MNSLSQHHVWWLKGWGLLHLEAHALISLVADASHWSRPQLRPWVLSKQMNDAGAELSDVASGRLGAFFAYVVLFSLPS